MTRVAATRELRSGHAGVLEAAPHVPRLCDVAEPASRTPSRTDAARLPDNAIVELGARVQI